MMCDNLLVQNKSEQKEFFSPFNQYKHHQRNVPPPLCKSARFLSLAGFGQSHLVLDSSDYQGERASLNYVFNFQNVQSIFYLLEVWGGGCLFTVCVANGFSPLSSPLTPSTSISLCRLDWEAGGNQLFHPAWFFSDHKKTCRRFRVNFFYSANAALIPTIEIGGVCKKAKQELS